MKTLRAPILVAAVLCALGASTTLALAGLYPNPAHDFGPVAGAGPLYNAASGANTRPLLVIRDQSLMTMPQLLTVFSLGGGAGTLGVQLAAAMVLVVPVVLAYAFLQRYFIESMAGAGVKG